MHCYLAMEDDDSSSESISPVQMLNYRGGWLWHGQDSHIPFSFTPAETFSVSLVTYLRHGPAPLFIFPEPGETPRAIHFAQPDSRYSGQPFTTTIHVNTSTTPWECSTSINGSDPLIASTTPWKGAKNAVPTQGFALSVVPETRAYIAEARLSQQSESLTVRMDEQSLTGSESLVALAHGAEERDVNAFRHAYTSFAHAQLTEYAPIINHETQHNVAEYCLALVQAIPLRDQEDHLTAGRLTALGLLHNANHVALQNWAFSSLRGGIPSIRPEALPDLNLMKTLNAQTNPQQKLWGVNAVHHFFTNNQPNIQTKNIYSTNQLTWAPITRPAALLETVESTSISINVETENRLPHVSTTLLPSRTFTKANAAIHWQYTLMDDFEIEFTTVGITELGWLFPAERQPSSLLSSINSPQGDINSALRWVIRRYGNHTVIYCDDQLLATPYTSAPLELFFYGPNSAQIHIVSLREN